MPDFPIIDAHVHLYDSSRISYPWLAGVPAIDASFLPAELDVARGAVMIEHLVFLEVDAAPGQELDEALFIDGLARTEPRIGAIVASAPVEKGAAVAEDLERLCALSRVKGIRRLIQSLPRAEDCVMPDFVAGVREVGRRGLTFDLCITHGQLASATELVRQCPEVSFVLDHMAKPPVASGRREPWTQEMRILAELPNVVVKLSGIVTEADHSGWTRDRLRPYVDHVVESFGFSRVLFGSDWPVVNLASTYPDWVDVMDGFLAGVPEIDLRRVYRDNAIRTYRLEA
ncbi:MAG: amidohydrolase family protein [Janthinobacterium lividum]